MALWDKLKGELIDIVEWISDDSHDTLVFRFQRYENQIKYGAKLIVRESQIAAFINEGKLADVFQPGTYTLTTQNLPILSTLQGWKYGFQSPFKAEVYFISTRTFVDQKWGTKNPIMLRDSEFGPVRLRAFGNYAIKIADAGKFLREIAGTDSRFTVEQLSDQLRDMIVARFSDVLGESKVPVLDLASNYDELSKFISTRIQPDFDPLGIGIVKFFVENISLPAEVEAALDKRSSMGVIGNLNAYTQYQAANAIGDAAKNPSGVASAGVGLGMGIGMAQQVSEAMKGGAGGGGPPPVPQAVGFYVAINGQQSGPFDLARLTEMAGKGELTRQTLVWRNGMAQWTAAQNVSDLTTLFASTPPPIPK